MEEVLEKTKTYTTQQAFEATLEYFKGDDLAARVWVNKYALKDSDGNLYELTPDDMHRRIAREIARIEQKYPTPLT
ncbi:MAG: ribonucleotide reductase N-terminal alpha domain-containing protein, partial [Weeksellaceae bacterium]|nr:ribonucleotide reductase N-terminal alpha domain-containing protein [Weeksellaceae bacterium]